VQAARASVVFLDGALENFLAPARDVHLSSIGDKGLDVVSIATRSMSSPDVGIPG
jgi:hypothetical protein